MSWISRVASVQRVGRLRWTLRVARNRVMRLATEWVARLSRAMRVAK